MESRRWIVLRGLARGIGHWGSFKESLQAKFPQDQFEFLEIPGNGSRHLDESPMKISEYVTDLRQQSRWVAENKAFQILSVSLGGMITVEWMQQHPEEVERAYVICTSSRDGASFYERFLPANLWKSRKLLDAEGNDELWERTILDMVANSHERKEAELPALRAVTRQYPMKLSNMLKQTFAASKYAFPEKAPGEIHLIGSYGDRLVSPNCTLAIAAKWGVKPVMHPWSGHDIAIDDPEWLLEQLL